MTDTDQGGDKFDGMDRAELEAAWLAAGKKALPSQTKDETLRNKLRALEAGTDTDQGGEADQVETVAMVRDAEQFEAPHSADVHPDEVENFKLGGWTLA